MAKASLTKTNIMRKVNRKRNPVESIAQLAREFGYNTNYWRWDTGMHNKSTAAPGSFRTKVKSLVGEQTYNQIRNESSINRLYR